MNLQSNNSNFNSYVASVKSQYAGPLAQAQQLLSEQALDPTSVNGNASNEYTSLVNQYNAEVRTCRKNSY